MNWKLAYAHNCDCKFMQIQSIANIQNAGLPVVQATVPGNVEMDLMREGILPDLYFSTNTLEAQNWEDAHYWYFSEFEVENVDSYLDFEGIDTLADIYVNGEFVQSVDNMFTRYKVRPAFRPGRNEVVVHIKPVMLEARKFENPAAATMMKYNYASAFIRKAPHSFGWDIMPRILTAGLWKPVTLRENQPDHIEEFYATTLEVDVEQQSAYVKFFIRSELAGDFARDYSYRIEGSCGESCFECSDRLFHTAAHKDVTLEGAKLWWPKPVGEPNLYDVKVTLYYKGAEVDAHTCRIGLRTVKLDRTDTTDTEGNGRFRFVVNGRPIFALGTNWVPVDALHANDVNRLPKALVLLDEIGCNMVRCWGGNVYEDELFYDFCDAHGILVWQDFALGCAVYPQAEDLLRRIGAEAAGQVKRLRNHACLALWAGDNEVDSAYNWSMHRDPNVNLITREVLRRAVLEHDFNRDYLPSSPYFSPAAYESGLETLPENHLWGPRDYFKGPYYKDTFCHFASETGYHGFNSPASLQRFLAEPERIFGEDGNPTAEYLVHASCMVPEMSDPYAYRIGLAYRQVETLFGKAEKELAAFAKQSQISQAEAKKYFIEKFRIGKGKRSGIIWWNLIDGWPQVSDAIVDYYYCKKLAFHYIQRSQQPVCLMFDEPVDGQIALYAVNDLTEEAAVKYSVINLTTGRSVLSGSAVLAAESSAPIDSLAVTEDEQTFYLIRWEKDGKVYQNHFHTNLLNISYEAYLAAIAKCGMDEFEGF